MSNDCTYLWHDVPDKGLLDITIAKFKDSLVDLKRVEHLRKYDLKLNSS